MRRAEEERQRAASTLRDQLALVHECVTALCAESSHDAEAYNADHVVRDGAGHVTGNAAEENGNAAAVAAGVEAEARTAVDRGRNDNTARRAERSQRRAVPQHTLPPAASLRPLRFQVAAALRRSPQADEPFALVAHHALDSLARLMGWAEDALHLQAVNARTAHQEERAALLRHQREAEERAQAAEAVAADAQRKEAAARMRLEEQESVASAGAERAAAELTQATLDAQTAAVNATGAREAAAAAKTRAVQAEAQLADTRGQLTTLQAELEAARSAPAPSRRRDHHGRSPSASPWLARRHASPTPTGSATAAATAVGASGRAAGAAERSTEHPHHLPQPPAIHVLSAPASEHGDAAENTAHSPLNLHAQLLSDDESNSSDAGSTCSECAETTARLQESERARANAISAEHRAAAALATQEQLVKELRDAGMVRMSRLRDLEGELRVAQAAAEERHAATQAEHTRLTAALREAQAARHTHVARLAELEQIVSQSGDARALVQHRDEAAALRHKVAALEARLTDVRADLNDDLKAQLLDVQDELDSVRRERDEERQSRDQRRQAAALEVATLRAEVSVRDNSIASLRETVALLQRDDSKELMRQFEERIEALEEEKHLIEAQVEEQRGLVRVANERIAFLEDVRQKDDSVARLEARLEKHKELVDQLKQASEEDALALRDLRARVLEHEATVEGVRIELHTRETELKQARELGRYFLAQTVALAQAVATALLLKDVPPLALDVWDVGPDSAPEGDLQAQVLAGLSEEQRKKRWEKSLSLQREEMFAEVSRLQRETERLAALESKYKHDAEKMVQVMRFQCDERVRLLEAKLQRKEAVLAGYDQDLGALQLLKVRHPPGGKGFFVGRVGSLRVLR